MTAMYFVVATPLMFAVCTVPGSMVRPVGGSRTRMR